MATLTARMPRLDGWLAGVVTLLAAAGVQAASADAGVAATEAVSTIWTVFILFACLFFCFLFSWTIHHFHLTFFPESNAVTSFNADLFMDVLLPIIVFEAGFSTNVRYFSRNVGTILLLAFIGTVISALVIGYGMYGFQQAGLIYMGPTPLDALLFGSIVSATDPVATLAIFGELNVDRTLYALVFGESILNDAVAITLLQILSRFTGSSSFGAADLFTAIGYLIGTVLGSLAIGVVLALVGALVLKHLRPPSRSWAMVVFLCVGYSTYTLASVIELSGIMAIFFGAFVLKHYAFYNIDELCRASLFDFLKTAAVISETVIYVLLGLAFFDPTNVWDFGMIGLALVCCLVGRAISVFGLVALANLGRTSKVPLNFQAMLWHSGLRGAMAFALSELLDPATVQERPVLITTTLGLVLITTSSIGASTPLVLRLLHIQTGDIETETDTLIAERREAALPGKTLLGRFAHIDRQYLTPFLSNRYRVEPAALGATDSMLAPPADSTGAAAATAAAAAATLVGPPAQAGKARAVDRRTTFLALGPIERDGPGAEDAEQDDLADRVEEEPLHGGEDEEIDDDGDTTHEHHALVGGWAASSQPSLAAAARRLPRPPLSDTGLRSASQPLASIGRLPSATPSTVVAPQGPGALHSASQPLAPIGRLPSDAMPGTAASHAALHSAGGPTPTALHSAIQPLLQPWSDSAAAAPRPGAFEAPSDPSLT